MKDCHSKIANKPAASQLYIHTAAPEPLQVTNPTSSEEKKNQSIIIISKCLLLQFGDSMSVAVIACCCHDSLETLKPSRQWGP